MEKLSRGAAYEKYRNNPSDFFEQRIHAKADDGERNFHAPAPGDGSMAASNNSTSNTAVNNMHPYLAVNFLIALQGVFPSRN